MKKVLLILGILYFVTLPSFAEDADVFDGLDKTNYSDTTQNLKPFTEKQYQEAIEQYKNKFQKPKKVKQKDIKTPTSTYSDAESNPEFKVLSDIINHKDTIMIPTPCISEYGQEISPGHYTMEYAKDNNNVEWLILSQGSVKVAKIPTHKSSANNDESTINYAYAVGKGDIIKLLYGNIDISVEATLDVLN